MPSGVIQGFDVETGELRFAWDMMRPDRNGLPPEGETYTPGTPNMWTTATVDEALGLVYLPMGNSSADYWSSSRRPAENEYSTALVALDVTTGKPRWHFQTVHKDVWDFDLGSQATLIDFPTGGGVVPALLLPTKQGDMYVFNRATGQLLHGVEERPVPTTGGTEQGERSPTQPFSLFATLRKPNLEERDMWGVSPIDQMFCRINFRKADYQGYYTPPSTNHYINYPGYNGGSDWGGVAVDPVRGVIVANYNDMPNYNRLVPREEANERGWFPRDDPRYIAQQQQASVRGGSLSKGEGAGDPQIGVPYAIDVNAGPAVQGASVRRHHRHRHAVRQDPVGPAVRHGAQERAVGHPLAPAAGDRHAEQRRLGGDGRRPDLHRRGDRRPDPRHRHRNRRDRLVRRPAGRRPGQSDDL